MKKKIAIVIIVILIIASAVGWYTLYKSKTPSSVEPDITPTMIPVPTLTGDYPTIPLPTAMAENPNYAINYVSIDRTYYISVLNSPFDQYRKTAEQDLIKRLNLTQNQACTQIKVNITMPYFVEQKTQPVYTTFSFCSQ